MIHINRTRRQTWWNNEHADSGAHGLLVSGNFCGTKIVSDGTWFAVPHPAYSNDIVNDMNENFRASEPDICYDARIANSNAFMHDYWTRGHTHAPSPLYSSTVTPTLASSAAAAAAGWQKAEVRGRPGDKPWGELVERLVQTLKN